jgi:RNA polymerase sigma-B factor
MSRGICFCSDDTDDDIDRTEARLIIEEALSQLSYDERRLIRMRFFDQRSQSEIAEEIGTSQMQVSRLISKLLVKMRTIIGAPESLPAAS